MEKAGRGRGTVERRGMPEGSGSLSRRGPYCCHGTTTAQKLGKDFLPPLSSLSDEELNLIDFLSLTKRQCVCYLPKETLEVCQRHEELAREMGMSVVGRGSPCERYADFGILCIPQNLL